MLDAGSWASLETAARNFRALYGDDPLTVEWCDLALWDAEMEAPAHEG